MIKLVVDKNEIEVKEDTTILQAASSLGITIPTLCFHEALGPHGSCRICLVEIVKGARPGLVASCTYPAEEGLVVETHNTKVVKTRKIMVELLLARCPESEKIQELANHLGIV
jgi:bidirectional [NiFe] hydrogenase diaphorase subunit